MESLGRKLARARKERGLSQKQVAARLGVSRERVRAIEAADDLLFSTLARHARVLGMSAAELGPWLEEAIAG